MELGIYTFAERHPDPHTGVTVDPAERIRDLIEEIELADEVGLDVFGLGEHHRPDFVTSAPAIALAAGAARTKRIRLTSAVSVISSDDPIRIFQDFATLDLISNGRAEIMTGRGSFIESFPLFGYDLNDYDELFSEKLELLLMLRENEIVDWPGGRFTPPIRHLGVYPRPVQDPLPLWIAVGGTPESVFRAGSLGLPLALAIIGGEPERFAPLAQLYREAGIAAGFGAETLKFSINAHGFVGDDTAEAADLVYPYFEAAMNKIGRERGWPAQTREHFDASYGPRGSLMLGTPEEIAEKIVAQHKIFQHDRFLLQISVGTLPHRHVMRSIELLGSQVAPLVKKELS